VGERGGETSGVTIAGFRQKHPAWATHAPSFCRFSAMFGVGAAGKAGTPGQTRRAHLGRSGWISAGSDFINNL